MGPFPHGQSENAHIQVVSDYSVFHPMGRGICYSEPGSCDSSRSQLVHVEEFFVCRFSMSVSQEILSLGNIAVSLL